MKSVAIREAALARPLWYQSRKSTYSSSGHHAASKRTAGLSGKRGLVMVLGPKGGSEWISFAQLDP